MYRAGSSAVTSRPARTRYGLVGPADSGGGRSRSAVPSRMARADLYQNADGFQLIELNMGSNLAASIMPC